MSSCVCEMCRGAPWLDGLEPGTLDTIDHAAEHIEGIVRVTDAKARWIGHKLHADVAIEVGHGLG